ncbi:CBO0543 family protein [Anaeroselena agilis]|uniref:CBO0543 family protein n=1 Tax=Anaeroselena agilis TaxID=3063788 RepID=A0ABU3P4N5_9FIRM|nr:CBO0543 family protein [Selenomonadales bacterium 4137-cl]
MAPNIDWGGLYEIYEANQTFLRLAYEYWRQYTYNAPVWWLLILTLILPWIIWWRFVDKARLSLCLSLGLLTLIVCTGLDAVGVAHGRWVYPHKLLGTFPHLVPVNFSLLPVSYMLIYQFFPSWKKYLRASFAMGLLFAFVGEPVLIFLGVYLPLQWYHHYSFPLYIAIAVAVKAAGDGMRGLQERHGKKPAD